MRDDGLPHQLPATPDADAGSHVHEIVDRAKDADPHQREHRRHGRGVLDPKGHGQEEDHRHHQHAAHRRRAGLAVMRLGPLGPDLLP